MRILQINNFHYSRGGSETVYLSTSSLLESHGHEVINFSQMHPQNYPSDEEAYFVEYQDFLEQGLIQKIKNFTKYIYSSEAKMNLERLLTEKKPDVAHLHNIFGGLSLSILPTLRKHKIPVVITLHDYKLLCPVYTFLDGQNKICEKCVNGNYLNCISKKCNKGSFIYSTVMALESYIREVLFEPEKYFDKIICVSKFSYNKHFNKPLHHKLTHLYNFSAAMEKEPFEIHNERYFLYFGRLSREKGVLTLIDSFKNRPAQKLIIAGTGPLEKQITESIAHLPQVEYVGFKSGDELKSLIKHAAFVVVPSEWYENNPMTIIESYFLGTPVIGADIGGIPEILLSQQTGFLFPPGDAKTLSNLVLQCSQIVGSRYYEMANSCRDFALENFSSQVHYQKLMTVYGELVSNSTI
jgi:glycosyltransferase involved in cell wall biosynthesis